jgi:hypothetical protein
MPVTVTNAAKELAPKAVQKVFSIVSLYKFNIAKPGCIAILYF